MKRQSDSEKKKEKKVRVNNLLNGLSSLTEKPLINVDDFHKVNSVMHRVSFVSGSLPGYPILFTFYYILIIVIFFLIFFFT
jgi:hypothetical protein